MSEPKKNNIVFQHNYYAEFVNGRFYMKSKPYAAASPDTEMMIQYNPEELRNQIVAINKNNQSAEVLLYNIAS